jgi:hypothetical protein
MIKSILVATTAILMATPALAENIQSAQTLKQVSVPNATSGLFGALSSSSGGSAVPPAMALSAVDVTTNIACRSKARAKYFELGARDMSKDDSNSQWGTVGSMQALVWCRGTQAIVAVAGSDYGSVGELRDELKKAF